MWIAYVVAPIEPVFATQWKKTNTDMFRDAPAVARSFTGFGSRERAKTQTYFFEGNHQRIQQGYLYSISGIGAVALLKYQNGSSRNLTRPNTKTVAQLLLGIGLKSNEPHHTEALSAGKFLKSSTTPPTSLNIDPVLRNEFVEDEILPRLLGTVAIERLILDHSNFRVSSMGLTARGARKLLALISFWNSQPPIEPAGLFADYSSLRAALNIENRTHKIREALLEVRDRGAHSFIAGSASFLGLLTLTDTSATFGLHGGWWALVCLIAGAIVWVSVRTLRF